MSALFDPASLPWRDMAEAPTDGTIIAVCFHAWDVKTNPLQIQFAQWINNGSGGCWCAPWNPNSNPYADGWLPLEALNIAAMEEPE